MEHSYLLNVYLLHMLQHFVNVPIVILIVSYTVNLLEIDYNGMSEDTGINIFVFRSIGVLSHVEGISHLLVKRLTQVWKEPREEIIALHVPGVLLQVMEALNLLVEVDITVNLVQSVLSEYLSPFHLLLCMVLLISLLN
jgi:hypothetical protein